VKERRIARVQRRSGGRRPVSVDWFCVGSIPRPDPMARGTVPNFTHLEMPFPLFEADIHAACVDAAGPCAVCDMHATMRFGGACYACFRAGKVDHAVDTVLGLVRREDAQAGCTHGIPLVALQRRADFRDYNIIAHPVDPAFPDEAWVSVVIDRERLVELSRTPTYRSRQGERWEFCCQLPCVFTGPLSPNTDLPTLLSSFDLDRFDAERIHAGLADGSIATYSFRCDVCQRQHVGWDRD